MGPSPEDAKGIKSELTDNRPPLDSALVPAAELSEEQRKLWEAFREQQQRRSCPGCGDDGSLF